MKILRQQCIENTKKRIVVFNSTTKELVVDKNKIEYGHYSKLNDTLLSRLRRAFQNMGLLSIFKYMVDELKELAGCLVDGSKFTLLPDGNAMLCTFTAEMAKTQYEEISGTLVAVLWILGGAPTRLSEATDILRDALRFSSDGTLCQYVTRVLKRGTAKSSRLVASSIRHTIDLKCSRAMLLYMAVVRPHFINGEDNTQAPVFPGQKEMLRKKSLQLVNSALNRV